MRRRLINTLLLTASLSLTQIVSPAGVGVTSYNDFVKIASAETESASLLTESVPVLDSVSDNTDESSSFVKVGVYFNQETCDIQKVLDRYNEIRYEACQNGYPDPRNTSINLTPDDYVPVEWDEGLSLSATLRSGESGVLPHHTRPNGLGSTSVFPQTYYYAGECLAWNYSGLAEGIEQWYEERVDYVNQNTSAQIGHYKIMVNPDIKYVGVSSVKNTYSTNPYHNIAGSFSSSPSDIKFTQPSGNYMHIQQIYANYVTAISMYESTDISISDTAEIPAYATVNFESGTLSAVFSSKTTNARIYDGATWTSSDESVATVDKYGIVTPKQAGSTVITATVNGNSASTTVNVKSEGEVITPSTATPIVNPVETENPGYTTSPVSTSAPTTTTPTTTSNPTTSANPATTPASTNKPGISRIIDYIGNISATSTPVPGSTAKPASASSTSSGSSNSAEINVSDLKPGFTFSTSTSNYEILNVEKQTLAYNGPVKETTVVSIPEYVYIGDATYTVTQIGAYAISDNPTVKKIVIPASIMSIKTRAFSNCSSLKRIIVKTKKLTNMSIQNNAFRGVRKSVILKVPKARFKKYRTIFRKKGLPKRCKFRR